MVGSSPLLQYSNQSRPFDEPDRQRGTVELCSEDCTTLHLAIHAPDPRTAYQSGRMFQPVLSVTAVCSDPSAHIM